MAVFGIPRRRVAVATAAVIFAFALLFLPGPNPDLAQSAVAAVLAIAVVALTAFPAVGRLGAPLVYVALVAVLIDGSGGTSSGFGGLFLLPLLWLAIVGSRRELVVGMVAVAVARILPVKLFGPPDYPSAAWRTSAVFGAVAIIACVTMQELVRVARLRAAELEAQNEQLRELDAAKDGFVALVSHELRTPLTSIIGYLEFLLTDGDPLTDDQRQFLTTVNRNVERLTTLVNELLFLVQVDAGRLELELSQIDVQELLAEATEAARPAADAKHIELALETAAAAPVVGDRTRMGQLIDNLVSNAVKFTPDGGRVALRADRAGDTVAVTVTDTGIGIPSDELPQLFGRFFRTSAATSAGIPGTGLGLAISQAIAAAHNSTITVQSTPAQGSTFRLELAAREVAADARRSMTPYPT